MSSSVRLCWTKNRLWYFHLYFPIVVVVVVDGGGVRCGVMVVVVVIVIVKGVNVVPIIFVIHIVYVLVEKTLSIYIYFPPFPFLAVLVYKLTSILRRSICFCKVQVG